MRPIVLLADHPRLRAFAAGFAAGLRAGDVVAFSGPVGAGKTTLIRALVETLQGSEEATSPSFTLWQRYPGAPPVNHLDLYRLERPGEAAEAGLFEAFDAESITFVEWPEREPGLLPARVYRVTIEGAGDEERRVEVSTP